MGFRSLFGAGKITAVLFFLFWNKITAVLNALERSSICYSNYFLERKTDNYFFSCLHSFCFYFLKRIGAAEGVHNDDKPRAGQGQQSDAPSFSFGRSSCGAHSDCIFRAHCAVSVHIEVDGTTLGRQVQPMSDKMGPATCVAPSIWVWFASTPLPALVVNRIFLQLVSTIF